MGKQEGTPERGEDKVRGIELWWFQVKWILDGSFKPPRWSLLLSGWWRWRRKKEEGRWDIKDVYKHRVGRSGWRWLSGWHHYTLWPWREQKLCQPWKTEVSQTLSLCEMIYLCLFAYICGYCQPLWILQMIHIFVRVQVWKADQWDVLGRNCASGFVGFNQKRFAVQRIRHWSFKNTWNIPNQIHVPNREVGETMGVFACEAACENVWMFLPHTFQFLRKNVLSTIGCTVCFCNVCNCVVSP